MTYRISLAHASLTCPAESVQAWIEYLLDLGQTPQIEIYQEVA